MSMFHALSFIAARAPGSSGTADNISHSAPAFTASASAPCGAEA